MVALAAIAVGGISSALKRLRVRTASAQDLASLWVGGIETMLDVPGAGTISLAPCETAAEPRASFPDGRGPSRRRRVRDGLRPARRRADARRTRAGGAWAMLKTAGADAAAGLRRRRHRGLARGRLRLAFADAAAAGGTWRPRAPSTRRHLRIHREPGRRRGGRSASGCRGRRRSWPDATTGPRAAADPWAPWAGPSDGACCLYLSGLSPPLRHDRPQDGPPLRQRSDTPTTPAAPPGRRRRTWHRTARGI